MRYVILLLGIGYFCLNTAWAGCWNDSQCRSNRVCECPSSSNNGNCDSVGKCVTRGIEKSNELSDQETIDAVIKLKQSVDLLLADLISSNTKGIDCTVSCFKKKSDGSTWTNSCGSYGCSSGCIPASCSEKSCSAGCR